MFELVQFTSWAILAITAIVLITSVCALLLRADASASLKWGSLDTGRRIAAKTLGPFALVLGWLKISPNLITLTSVIPALFFVACMYFQLLPQALFYLALTAIFDVMDGLVARTSSQESTFGMILDSQVDRYADFLILFGFFLYERNELVLQILITTTMMGSFMVSYSTLMARYQKIDLSSGRILMRRPERIITLILGLILAIWITPLFVPLAIATVAILANLSALQLLVRMWQSTRENVQASALPQHEASVFSLELARADQIEKEKILARPKIQDSRNKAQ